MKQVVQSVRSGKLGLRDVPAPGVGAGRLVVRTRASLISAGTERMLVDFARKSMAGKARARPDLVRQVLTKVKRDGLAATMRAVMARLDEPMPLGYSAAGEVVAIGAGLEGRFHVGQRVAIAGAGVANHAELSAVPVNLAVPMPDDVTFEDACYGTMGAIALHAVRNAAPRLGDWVAVLGVGLLGQLAVQFLALSGARVIALDYDPARLELARRLGAEAAFNLGEGGIGASVHAITGGLGCDAILIAAASESAAPFETAAEIARDRATVSMVGMCGTAFPYASFMKKELSIVVSRSYGPGRYDPDYEGRGMAYPEGWVRWTETANIAEAVRLMDPGLPRRLDVGALTTHSFPFEDAEKAYALVVDGGAPSLGVVLCYAGEADPAPEPRPAPPAPKVGAAERCTLGVLGAGAFARTVLLPALKAMDGVDLRTVVTTRGMTAEHAKATFGFDHAATDTAAVLDDERINAVLVATRHATHADLTVKALQAGKSVLVEKPLALTREELGRVMDARDAAPGFVQVGFNRRFAPLAIKARDAMAGRGGPRYMLLRVNAGHVPAESWVQAADEGGGRILGEVCHFIDLARFFAGAPITAVHAEAAQGGGGTCDDVTVTLTFADGSLATVAYTALGDTAMGKERFELYAGGAVAVLDNFRRLSVTVDGREKVVRAAGGQDKGFNGSLSAFAAAVQSGGPAPIDEAELFETSLATIAAVDSLREGRRITL